jgi:TIR domain
MAKSFDVFLCYNRADRPTVLQVAKAIRDAGLEVWLDDWVVAPGEPWQLALEAAIESLPAAVVAENDGLATLEPLGDGIDQPAEASSGATSASTNARRAGRTLGSISGVI